MFGKNKPMASRHDEEDFLVTKIFPTIQGEGPFAGQPALFLRLAGCNLTCSFCDTDFDPDKAYQISVEDLCDQLHLHLLAVKTDLLVITGGEPMLQNLPLLIRTIWKRVPMIQRIQIETAGTVWPEGMHEIFRKRNQPGHAVFMVVSPKTPKVHFRVQVYADAWKYIIRAENVSAADGLPNAMHQAGRLTSAILARPGPSRAPVYVQPMDEQSYFATQKNMEACAEIAMKFGYWVSLQTHKILKVE